MEVTWKTTWLCWRMSYSEPSPSKVSVLFSEKHSDSGDCTYVWHTHTKPLCYGVLSPIWLIKKYLGGTLSVPMSWGLLGNVAYSNERLGLQLSLVWSLSSNFQNCLRQWRTDFLHGGVVTFASIWTGNIHRNALPCNILYNFILFGFPIICKENK